MNAIEELVKGYKRAPAITNSSKAQWPQTVKCRFIEPGLVDYEDLGLGTILVQRPFLDKVRNSFVGKPVIDQQHKDAKPENFKEIADGVVIRVWNNPADGWDWCEFLVWDEETLRHTKDPNYFVSCAYDPTRIDRNGGKYHNIDYDGEFLDGAYTHLAIVKDPRYESARIVWNSVGGKMKNPFKLFSRKEDVAEVEGEETFLELGNGEKISVANAVEQIRTLNRKPVHNGAMQDDDVIEIDGKKMTGKDIKNALEKAKGLVCSKHETKNCDVCNSEGEKGEKAGSQKSAKEEEEEEGKKRDKGEAKNSVAKVLALGLPKEDTIKVLNSLASKDEYQDNHEAQEIFAEALNALDPEEKPGKHLEDFRSVAEMRNNQPGVPMLSTMHERLKIGNELYGKTKKEEVA